MSQADRKAKSVGLPHCTADTAVRYSLIKPIQRAEGTIDVKGRQYAPLCVAAMDEQREMAQSVTSRPDDRHAYDHETSKGLSTVQSRRYITCTRLSPRQPLV